MNLLKLLDVKTILILVLSFVIFVIYFLKNSEIESLKDEKISIYEGLTKTNKELKDCDYSMFKQNKEIESLRVEIKYTEPKVIEKLKNVYVQDTTCDSKLKAYKELFND